MTDIFNFSDYRLYFKELMGLQEKVDKKYRSKLTEAMRISSSLFSQILKGEKNLSSEQSLEAANFIGLGDRETEYLITLADLGRAGSTKLQTRLKLKAQQLQSEAKAIASRVPKDVALSDLDKAIYYSSWIYTGVRNLLPTPAGGELKSIADRLGLPLEKVDKAVNFLIEIGLCENKQGKLHYKPGFTHLDSNHPLILRHHQNWRQRAIAKMDFYKDPHVHYTSPMSLSASAAEKIRDRLREEIKQIIHESRDGSPEIGYCLNIDWFEY